MLFPLCRHYIVICAKADDAELFLKWSVCCVNLVWHGASVSSYHSDIHTHVMTVLPYPAHKVTVPCLPLRRSGLVESKIRILVGKLEVNEGIELAHVYPTSFGSPTPDR